MSEQEIINRYADHYVRGIMGNDIDKLKAQILWTSLPKKRQVQLLQMRCQIPNCSDMRFAEMLSEIRTDTRQIHNLKYHADSKVEIR